MFKRIVGSMLAALALCATAALPAQASSQAADPTVFTPTRVDSLSASVNSTSWSWARTLGGPAGYDPPTVVTASGGTAPYSYTWVYVGGDTAISPMSSSSATTSWLLSATLGGYPHIWGATWRCLVTDSAGGSVYAPNVGVDFDWETGM